MRGNVGAFLPQVRLPCRLDLFDVLLGPRSNRTERLDKRAAKSRERVLHGGRYSWNSFTVHQSVPLKALERLAQDFVRDVFDAALQLTKTMGPLAEEPHDERSPLVRDSVQGLPGWALCRVDVVLAFAHGDGYLQVRNCEGLETVRILDSPDQSCSSRSERGTEVEDQHVLGEYNVRESKIVASSPELALDGRVGRRARLPE